MITTISPQIRLAALIGLLAAAALAAATFVVARGPLSSPDEAASKPREARASSAATATKAPARTNAATKTKASAGKAQVTKKRELATGGLPIAVARALRRHDVVVVSVYTPYSVVDRLARAEARAGAEAADAGFVALDVLQRRTGERVAAKLGAVDSPAVFVFDGPRKPVLTIDGFVDLHTVAQAVENARA